MWTYPTSFQVGFRAMLWISVLSLALWGVYELLMMRLILFFSYIPINSMSAFGVLGLLEGHVREFDDGGC